MKIPPTQRGILTALFLAFNTLLWSLPLLIASVLKLILPIPMLQSVLRFLMHACAKTWISFNSWMLNRGQPIQWQVEGLQDLSPKSSYLVTSNHRSWVDILALQHVFNHRIPFLKFFLKQELIWVPVIGLCWWALDFPFMKRYSKAYLEKHPEKRGTDLATTRKACEKFKGLPVSIFNFLEGTRFTLAKQAQQQSPFKHLLKPKAGGIAFVLDAMGEQLTELLDVTLDYPDQPPSFWGLLCGRISKIRVQVQRRVIPQEFLGKQYDQDADYRAAFQAWVNQIWMEKDTLLDSWRQGKST